MSVSISQLHTLQAQFKWTYVCGYTNEVVERNGKVCASLVSYFKRALLIKFCKTHKTHKHNHVYIDTTHLNVHIKCV